MGIVEVFYYELYGETDKVRSRIVRRLGGEAGAIVSTGAVRTLTEEQVLGAIGLMRTRNALIKGDRSVDDLD